MSFEEIFDDAKIFLGGNTYAEMQDKIKVLQEKIDTITAERDFATAENAILKNEVASLTAEIKLFNMQMAYKDEIIALNKQLIHELRNK